MTGVLTGVIGNWVTARAVEPGVDAAKWQNQFTGAFDLAVEELSADHPELLEGLSRAVDRKGEFQALFIAEFENCLQLLNLHQEPSATRLYQKYIEISEEHTGTFMDEDQFELALSAVWTLFRQSMKSSPLLRQLLLDQYTASKEDEHVTRYEALQLMRVYCRVRLHECEKQLKLKYLIKHPPPELGEEENYQEFCTYHSPPMVASMPGREAGELQIDTGDIFSPEFRFGIYTGIGGVGKTRFFEEFEKNKLQQLAGAQYPEYLPFLLKAQEIGDEADISGQTIAGKIEHILLEHCDERNISRDSIPAKAKALAEYLRVRKDKLLLLVDGFDQVDAVKEDSIINKLLSNSRYGMARRYIATRPFKRDRLYETISGKTATSALVRILPFSDELLEQYFGIYHEQVSHLTNDLKKRHIYCRINDTERDQHNNVHFLQVPLIARLLKEMTISGSVRHIKGKADLFAQFLSFVEKKQVEKFGICKDSCRSTFARLEQLALRLLTNEEGMDRIEFSIEQIDEQCDDASAPVAEMERFDLLTPFIDSDNRPVFRFQHQLLQEFLAAKALYRQYRKNRLWKHFDPSDSFFQAISTIQYDPDEVAEFLALLIADGSKHPVAELIFWHEQVLMNPAVACNWLRTYGLHIRDTLAARHQKAGETLAQLYADEDRNSEIIEPDSMMVTVPQGTFVMGGYQRENERPVQLVTVQESYDIDRFPVTNLQFCTFLNDAYPDEESPRDDEGNVLIYPDSRKLRFTGHRFKVNKGYNRHPATGVTWYGAVAFCRWRTSHETGEEHHYRLPTEKEWEKAARGCLARTYPWGNIFVTDRCNTAESAHHATTPIGNFTGSGDSAYGCCDMSGNVWEWTSDTYTNTSKVIRGGSWFNVRSAARCAFRFRLSPDDRLDGVGFRCARTKKVV